MSRRLKKFEKEIHDRSFLRPGIRIFCMHLFGKPVCLGCFSGHSSTALGNKARNQGLDDGAKFHPASFGATSIRIDQKIEDAKFRRVARGTTPSFRPNFVLLRPLSLRIRPK